MLGVASRPLLVSTVRYGTGNDADWVAGHIDSVFGPNIIPDTNRPVCAIGSNPVVRAKSIGGGGSGGFWAML